MIMKEDDEMNKAFNKVIKSHVLLAVLTVFAAVLLTSTVTYSLFQIQNKNTKNQTIAIGDLSADMTSITGAMVLNDLYPKEAKKVDDNDKKYEFTIKNDGTYDLKYEIYLSDSTDLLLKSTDKYDSYKKIDSNNYRYINYKLDGLTIANLESINEDSRFVLLKGTLKAGQSEDHFLQFFLDSKDTTTTGAPNDISGSVLSLDIYMDAVVSDTLVDSIIAEAKVTTPSRNDSGLYKTVDNYGDTYYFKGNVQNNYVKFGNYYWRILRINGDGTMRLLYDGTIAHDNEDTSIEDRIALKSSYSARGDDAKYAGYMYGVTGTAPSISKKQALGNTNDSTIKEALDEWYKTNIVDKGYEKMVADKIFCNDRTTASTANTWMPEDTTLGFGNNYTVYGAFKRISENKVDSLICLNDTDSFTVNNSKGNGALKYGVGLPTADELLLASGENSYIDRAFPYWTMTPHSSIGEAVKIYALTETGSLETKNSDEIFGVIPVINLSNEFTSKMIGTGSKNDPYRIS